MLRPVTAGEAEPGSAGALVEGVGGASASAVERVKVGVAGSETGDPSLGVKERVAPGASGEREEEFMQQDDVPEEVGGTSGAETSVSGSGWSVSRLIGDLLDSEEEMDEADGAEEEENLECGQRFVPSIVEGEEFSGKKARIEGVDSESGDGSLHIALSVDSELESASSPGLKRW